MKKRSKKIVALLIGCMVLTSAWCLRAGEKEIPVPNGGFEDGKAPWEGSGKVVSDVKHSGKNSILIKKGCIYHKPASKKMIFGVVPGYDYKVVVWIKTDGCQKNGVGVTAVCLGGPGEKDQKWLGGWLEGELPRMVMDKGQSPALIATGKTHGWKKFEAIIPADQLNAQTKALFIYLRHDFKGKDATGKAWFDDLKVYRIEK